MSTQVVRVQGYSKGSLTCIGNECDRTPGIEHRNSDIVLERSALNYSFKDVPDGHSFYSEHADIISSLNAQYTEKKGGIAFEGMLITADSEFFQNLGYDVTKNEKPPKAVKEFFEKSYNWALEQIGYKGTDKNVISAKVHYDEKTPHLHIYYVPITDKWQEKVYQKDENGKVLQKIKQQAKAYSVNRDGFKNLQADKESVKQEKEQLKIEQEQLAAERDALSSERQRVDAAYQKQLNLNRILDQTERDLTFAKERNKDLDRSVIEKTATISKLEKDNRQMSECLADVVKAVRMLQEDEQQGYGVQGLTEKQNRLIDAIRLYGAIWEKKLEHSDLANEILTKNGISQGIKSVIKELSPKKEQSRDLELF